MIYIWRRAADPTPAPAGAPSSAAASSSAFAAAAMEDEIEQKETWQRVGQLRGHFSDIYDLSWSPDSKGPQRLFGCAVARGAALTRACVVRVP